MQRAPLGRPFFLRRYGTYAYAASFTASGAALPRIMSLALSAIISVDALRLAEIMRGMIEASTTRRPSIPCTRNWSSTTAQGLSAVPIRQVQPGWKVVVPRSVTTLNGVPNESVTSNNSITQEVVAYDTTLLNNDIDWAGQFDDGIGIGWTGGQAGCGAYILPPFYPIYVSHTTCRIMSNFGNVGFTMKVYDDDGPDGSVGTLLDSVYVDAADGQAGDHAYALAQPFMLDSGGLYVQWYMEGQNVNIAQDINPPFSLRSYEVIQGAWANYRDREIADFHLGLRMGFVPAPDAGVGTIDQPDDGQTIGGSTNVRIWIHNYGNVPLTGIPCNYSFNGGSPVTQTYNGPDIAPGDSVLFMFAQPLVPLQQASGPLCAWTSYNNDLTSGNDTTCITINMVVGVQENAAVRLRMSPVPASSDLLIDGMPRAAVRLEVYDMTGALRMERSARNVSGPVRLDVANLAACAAYLFLAIGPVYGAAGARRTVATIFLAVCLATVTWMFRTGYRLKS